MPTRLRALVTAGGTREFIDDVRVITNLSRGRFGAAIARALCAQGVETTLVGSSEFMRTPEGHDPRFQRISFVTFADLAQILKNFQKNPPDILFMAAAVSDYSPVSTSGKISSDQEEMVIRLQKNTKLLHTFREEYGKQCFLIGFKLLSAVPRSTLIEVAKKQVQSNRLNLTVANDLKHIKDEKHPVILVTPEGGTLSLSGSKDEVAKNLVSFVLKRQRVTWSQSKRVSSSSPTPDETTTRTFSLLSFAQNANLLPGKDGNVSTRVGGTCFWTTPRQVQKSTLTLDELVYVEVDLPTRAVRYQGLRKPSIDSAVHGWLYQHFPWIDALLHFHKALSIPTIKTSFPYPCGTREEAEEIYQQASSFALQEESFSKSFLVELVDHGYLLALQKDGTKELVDTWESVKSAYRQHFEELGEKTLTFPSLSPVWFGAKIVGALAFFPSFSGVSLFLHPEERNKGIGAQLIDALIQRKDTLLAHEKCKILEHYQGYGYKILRQEERTTLLTPPTLRTDLKKAASVCLYNPLEKQILLGQKQIDPWKGFWAFPGGKIHPDELSIAAAKRELQEETDIRLPHTKYYASTEVFVGQKDLAYRVTNFFFPVLHCIKPKPSQEMNAKWFSIEEARRLRPMAAGTRAVLRQIPIT